MRERLAASFALVALVLLAVAGLVRAYALDGQLRERASVEAVQQSRLVAAAVGGRDADLETQLRDLVGPDTLLEYHAPGRPTLTASGAGFEDENSVSASVALDQGTLTVRRSPMTAREAWADQTTGIVFLLLITVALAALVAVIISRYLARPFRKLTAAATALGRGRFDLELPKSSVPEVRAISRALEDSATLLRERIERDQQFSLHISHELRTVLTRLRFELEELLASSAADSPAAQTAATCLQLGQRLDHTAGELVEISRRGLLAVDAEIPLRDLATQAAQRWADRLAGHDRLVTAAVEGDIELPLTPGPVEQVLDLLLTNVVRYGAGDVRLVFEGDRATIRVRVTCLHSDQVTEGEDELVAQAQSMVRTLGGRFEAIEDGHRITVLLPRR